MAYLNAILDEAVAYGFEGGPSYSTDIVDLENGLEQRDSNWLYPKHKYTATFDNLQDDARDLIIEVFHAARGRRHSFKFKDWNDFEATLEPLQVGVGNSNPVQLYKTYNFGEAFTIRPIQALKTGTCTVLKDGVAVAGVFDDDTGLFYPTANFAAGTYTWSGQFYVWVRFNNDYNAFTINSWQANTSNIDLMEDKLETVATNLPLSWEE